MRAQLLSCVSFVIPWTVARQAPLSMGFLQVRIRDLPNPGTEPTSRVPALAGRFFTTEPPGSHLESAQDDTNSPRLVHSKPSKHGPTVTLLISHNSLAAK